MIFVESSKQEWILTCLTEFPCVVIIITSTGMTLLITCATILTWTGITHALPKNKRAHLKECFSID